jgi:hypothetical protein
MGDLPKADRRFSAGAVITEGVAAEKVEARPFSVPTKRPIPRSARFNR